MFQDSEFVRKEPCPKCGSKDNLARYSDGHAFCFSYCGYREKADGSVLELSQSTAEFDPIQGDFRALQKRGITEETCRKYGYKVGQYNGQAAQICDIYNDQGQLVAQKIRTPDKGFAVNGKLPKAFIGQHLFSGGKKVVICEGEIDMLTMSQIQGNRFPVVSVASGCKGAKKTVNEQLDWLAGFEEIILCFDNDEPGREAVEEVASMLVHLNVKVMELPLKDPNEMLLAGRTEELINAMWRAREYKPDGMVDIDELYEEATQEIETGLPYFMPTLTDLTYGRHYGDIIGLAAGTGMGKSDWFTQQISHDVYDLDLPVCVYFLEQAPKETLRRLWGKRLGEPLHVPADHRTQEYVAGQAAPLREQTKRNLYLYDNFGIASYDALKAQMIYYAHKGVKLHYIDHLTALATGSAERDEREELERIMADMAALAKRYGLIIHFISHLATPEGKSHEEGGRVSIRQFRGSRAIGYWSYFLFGMERNQQHSDEDVRSTTTFRPLKDRRTGQSVGKTIPLGYCSETGRLFEKAPEAVKPGQSIEEF